MFPRKNTVAPASSISSSLNDNSIQSESSFSDDDDDNRQQKSARPNTQLTAAAAKKTPSKQPTASIQNRLTSKAKSSRKPRSAVSDDDDRPDTPPRIRQQEKDKTDFINYALDNLGLDDHVIQEVDVEQPVPRKTTTWKNSVRVPRWLLLLGSNLFIILLIVTFCVVFIYKNMQAGHGQSCLMNSNCNSYVGLSCTAGKCNCSSVHFWDGVQCKPQRTFNRSCTSQNQCNSLSKLLCMNVTTASGTDNLCWCSSYRYWTGDQCSNLKSFNQPCTSNGECNINSNLICINGLCDCNSTQFWNNEYCENKRAHGDQCFDTYWCNNATGGLECSTWAPTTGTCDCLTNQYWWSTNQTCFPQLPINATCSFDYQCITNLSLACSTSTSPRTCQCSSRYWYNTTKCIPKLLNEATCTSSLQCDSTVGLSCNLTAQKCICNQSDTIWDGIQCVIRRSIGGACVNSTQCLERQNLICATSGVWNGTCSCPTNYYWNPTTLNCTIKKLWFEPCVTSYECYDGGYLSCQPSATLNTTVCDCGNYTDYWTGFLNNTYSGYCTPKINYGTSTFNCTSSYQCRDYNYITCIGGKCTCSQYQYWDGTMCAPKLNYSFPCNSTAMCRNWTAGPNLQCLTPLSGGSIKQCLCLPTQYFDYCTDLCFPAKSYQQTCNISSCYATSMCDPSRGLSCINNICNCTGTEWWNTTRCVPKGTYLASCTAGEHYQCEQYNRLACVPSNQCQCGSTMYWSSSMNFCQDKQTINGTCASTVECDTAAGVGLSCLSGRCQCSPGYYWNNVPRQCDTIPG